MKKLMGTVLVGMAGICGCNTPAKDPPADVSVGTAAVTASAPPATSVNAPVVTASATSSASAAPTPAPATSASGKGCASDADCRTFSSYCAEAPCACRVLAKGEGDPKCLGSGPKVNCFANPCMNKAARCQSGACVLNANAKGGATEK